MAISAARYSTERTQFVIGPLLEESVRVPGPRVRVDITWAWFATQRRYATQVHVLARIPFAAAVVVEVGAVVEE